MPDMVDRPQRNSDHCRLQIYKKYGRCMVELEDEKIALV